MSAASYLVIMLIWLIFDTALSLVALATDVPRGRAERVGGSMVAVIRLLLVVLTAMQLGGGAA